MRTLWKVGYKLFSTLKSDPETRSESKAITPIIGSLLSLLITVTLVSAVAIVINSSGSDSFSQAHLAKITLESCEGGLSNSGPKAEIVTFKENKIILVHEGGASIPLDIVSIKISGYGNSYGAVFGQGFLKGNVTVFYKDLSPEGKSPKYKVRNNAVLENGLWETGEKLTLCGQDSSVRAIDSSVKVSVDGKDNTSDNYGFKAGSQITLKVIDSESRNVIAEQKAVVELANE